MPSYSTELLSWNIVIAVHTILERCLLQTTNPLLSVREWLPAASKTDTSHRLGGENAMAATIANHILVDSKSRVANTQIDGIMLNKQ